jgi:hypothetical protein
MDIMDSDSGEREGESDAEAVAAERSGRTNTAREMTDVARQDPPSGRWDSIGEPGEGLDELQGLHANDGSNRDHLAEQGDEATSETEFGLPNAIGLTPALWHQLASLEGQTIETPKGEPFRVIAVTTGEGVTVGPLDGAREWDVTARELEAAWAVVRDGAQLDGLASIRLQEAGVGSAHPEYVAGLIRALRGNGA